MSYIEEDLSNKSEILLKCNPVHEKIAVLVHGGRAIAESTVILEYIEETWPNNPLLPIDPFDKAQARFWIKFLEDKVLIKNLNGKMTLMTWVRTYNVMQGRAFVHVFHTVGEEQVKATKEAKEVLRVIEEDALEGENKFFNGNTIGLIDIAFGWLAGWLPIFEEVNGLKLLDHNSFPNIRVWIENFKKDTVIKENLPSCDEMLPYYMRHREKFVALASQYLHYRHSFVFVHFKGMARQFLV
ncbi:hypothetical protein LguiA_020585 [Lonicera macranthoides]